jgi:type I restriction enzyme S subunit
VVEPLFAAYALSRATGVFKHDNRGTTIKGVTKKDLRELSLLLPPLPEQKKIADILGSVDEAIRATKAVIEQTKKVKKGLLQQLLTRGIGHTRFKQTEIGEIPESWEVVRLGDVASCDRYSCVGGPFGSDLTSQDYVDVPGVPVIRGANMSGGPPGSNFDEAGFVYVSENKAESLHRNTAYRGDLLFTQRGTLGQVALIPANSFYPKYIVSQSQMKIALDAERAVPEYMLSLFGSDWGAKTIDDDAIATGVPHINLGIMKSFRVPLPPIEEQRAIAAMMAGPNKTTKVSLGVLHELTQMREGLMQDLLTGKVRV